MLSSILPLKAQYLVPNSSITGVCYAGDKTTRIYIPPPGEFYRKGGSKGGGTITVNYSGFSKQAVTAIKYAVSVLETLLPDDTRVTIFAYWKDLGGDGVLGSSSIAGYVGGWSIDALDPFAYYPVALAEKIFEAGINGDAESDIDLNINSTINWYFDTDGNVPADQYDLVTVVLHELCHGLGFFDSMNIDGATGSYGLNSIPMIYDTFLESAAGNRLTDTLNFINPSASLKTALTSGQIYFNGPLLSNYTSGSRAKIWAPSKWDPGSSISHLDEDETFDPNKLMTPYINKREAIHNPGKYTFSILGDLGWVNTRIIHEPMQDTEENLSEITLSVVIKSDTLYNHDRVALVYSFDNFLSYDTIFLISPNSNNTFRTILPIPAYNTDLQYYFFVEDVFLRTFRSPSFIELFKYEVYIGVDTVKPLIEHTPIDYYLQTVDSIGFQASVYDNHGIDTVYVEYMVNERAPEYIGLKAGKLFSYSTVFNAKPEGLNGGDSIRYRIFARDSASVPNTSILPETGYFVIDIETIEAAVDSYATDFTASASDFLNNGFDILQPSDFSGNSLNSKHPYASPEDNSKSYDFTSLLRYPLKFNESGMLITFNEIVLVEPGEPGSLFGSEDFYDYVILEGSKNFGKSWFSLTDGYDCRYLTLWETSYNSSIIGMNSNFPGNESMLRKHTVYYKPSADISSGDTLLLRFRLFSDPYANGWGWMIDDLEINPLIDAVEKISIDPLKIYPNPGNGIIKISSDIDGYTNRKPVRYSIFNSAGICLVKDRSLEDSVTTIDISANPTGLYLIVIYRDEGLKAYKYSLIK